MDKPWYVYLVRALNGALYCGISDDPHKRFARHRTGKGARFFRSSPAVALVYIETLASKSEALRRERAIKRLAKSHKEALVLGWCASAFADATRGLPPVNIDSPVVPPPGEAQDAPRLAEPDPSPAVA